MKYNFVEIGCSIYNTYVDRFGLDVNGLLVEPMPNLFKVVPNSKTVKKENAAITHYDGKVEFHLYHGFDPNRNYKYHGTNIKSALKEPNGWDVSSIDPNPKRIDNCTGKLTVPAMTLKTLFKKYNITEVDYFKVDAEGHDHIVIQQLLNLMDSGITVNKEIMFEYAYPMCNKLELDRLSNIICEKYSFNKEPIEADIKLWKEM